MPIPRDPPDQRRPAPWPQGRPRMGARPAAPATVPIPGIRTVTQAEAKTPPFPPTRPASPRPPHENLPPAPQPHITSRITPIRPRPATHPGTAEKPHPTSPLRPPNPTPPKTTARKRKPKPRKPQDRREKPPRQWPGRKEKERTEKPLPPDRRNQPPTGRRKNHQPRTPQENHPPHDHRNPPRRPFFLVLARKETHPRRPALAGLLKLWETGRPGGPADGDRTTGELGGSGAGRAEQAIRLSPPGGGSAN